MILASPVFVTLTIMVFKTKGWEFSDLPSAPSWLRSRAQTPAQTPGQFPYQHPAQHLQGLFWCAPSSSSGSLPLLSNTHPLAKLPWGQEGTIRCGQNFPKATKVPPGTFSSLFGSCFISRKYLMNCKNIQNSHLC